VRNRPVVRMGSESAPLHCCSGSAGRLWSTTTRVQPGQQLPSRARSKAARTPHGCPPHLPLPKTSKHEERSRAQNACPPPRVGAPPRRAEQIRTMSMKRASAPWTRACTDGRVPQCAVASELLKAVTQRRCAPKTEDSKAEEKQRLPRSSHAVSTTSSSRLRPRSADRGTTMARQVCSAHHHCQPSSTDSPPPPAQRTERAPKHQQSASGACRRRLAARGTSAKHTDLFGEPARSNGREQRVPERQQRVSVWDCQCGGAVGCSPPAIACPRQSAAQRARRLPDHPSGETTRRRACHSCAKATSGVIGGVRLTIRRLTTIKSKSYAS